MVSPALRSMMLVLTFTALTVSTAGADECLDYSAYPHWISQMDVPVKAVDVVVDGDLAYLALTTAGIAIVDISDPWHPVQVGRLGDILNTDWPARALRLALGDQHLYATDVSTGVYVVDVSDPAAPVPVTLIPVPGASGVALYGDHLYISYAPRPAGGLEIVDVSDPESPLLVGSIYDPHTVNVRVFGDLLYHTLINGFLIWDLTDPVAPDFLSALYIPAGQHPELLDMTVQGDLAYLADLSGAHIVDVSDPSNPSLTGPQLPPSWMVTAHENLLYLGGIGQLEIWDTTNPQAPEPVTHLPAPENRNALPWVRYMAIVDGFGYAAADFGGLVIADLAGESRPPSATTLELPANAKKVRMWGDRALVAAGPQGLLVIDLTDPAHPARIGRFASEDARAVITEGQLAYLADGGDGLKVIDLGDPSTPRLLGHLDTFSRVASGLALEGDRIYLASGLSGLKIIEVADPASPQLLGTAATASEALDVCVADPYAYVLDGFNAQSRLQVLDVSDPEAAFVVASLDLHGSVGALLLDGSTLYVSGGGYDPLVAVDVSIPTAPVELGWLPITGQDLVLDGSVLIAPRGSGGVSFVDCSDPTELEIVGFLPIDESCSSVAVAGSHLLVAGDRLHTAARPCQAAPGVVECEIDIRPGSAVNEVNCKGNPGVLPVALLTTESFDALSVDHSTVRFGPGQATEVHAFKGRSPRGEGDPSSRPVAGTTKRHEQDVDHDGDLDLLFHFAREESGIQCGDTGAVLTGQTYDGQLITGTDRIRTAPGQTPQPEWSGALAVSPNPFNPATTIQFVVDQPQRVEVGVYDVRGRLVATLVDGYHPVGRHTVTWRGLDAKGNTVPSGMYFFRIDRGGRVDVQKAMLIK